MAVRADGPRRHIHLFGASGSGTTTIARQVCQGLGYAHFDSDDYFWLPTGRPFTVERDHDCRIRMLKKDLAPDRSWALSGSLTGWGDELLPLFDLVVFTYVPSDIRLERLKQREYKRYGAQVLPGGGRYQETQDFLAWAAAYDTGTETGRSLSKHEAWLKGIPCPVIRVTNLSLEESVVQVIRAIQES